MPSSAILAVIVPIAAVILILLVVRAATGGSAGPRIVDAGEAHQAIQDADITFSPSETCVSADARAALMADGHHDAIAIAYVVGDRIAARVLRGSDIIGARWRDEPGGNVALWIELADFGCPELVVRLTPQNVARWRERIDALLAAHVAT